MAGVCVFALLASVVIAWASNRSALWNMLFGAMFALTVLAVTLIAMWVAARMAFPR